MANLTTKAKVKTYLGLSGTTYDDLIDEIIAGISSQAEVFCNRIFERAEYTEYFDTKCGDNKLFVKNYPLVSIASVSNRTGLFGNPTWQAINSNEYLLNENGKISLSFNLPYAERFIKVVYTGGYLIDFDNEDDPAEHTLPAGLTQIITEMVAQNFNLRKSAGILSESTEGQSITFQGNTDTSSSTNLSKKLYAYRNFNI